MEKISNEVFSYFDFKKENSSREEILFICDHSSNQIPNLYNNLGLDKKSISIDVHNNFNPIYKVNVDKRQVLSDLKKCYEKCS